MHGIFLWVSARSLAKPLQNVLDDAKSRKKLDLQGSRLQMRYDLTARVHLEDWISTLNVYAKVHARVLIVVQAEAEIP